MRWNAQQIYTSRHDSLLCIEETLKLLRNIADNGCAVLISTHIIDIVSDIFDEAYIMKEGHIIKRIKKDELQEESLKDYFFELTEGE